MRTLFRTGSLAIAASLIVMSSPSLKPAAAQVTSTQDTTVAALSGDWRGVLDAQGTQLHLELHITTTDGKTEAVLVSTDQDGARLPATSIDRTGDTMTFAIVTIDGSYTGTLSPDARKIDGTWSQGGADLPLSFSRN